MRRSIVVALIATEALLACAIVTCSLQLSHWIVRNRMLGDVAASLVHCGHRFIASTHDLAKSTRNIAINGVRVHITIGDA